jgi:LPPG:FO 2-phospho-L-lactate transferase|tara:strand:+ start:642 stop:1604 length:963 start_codon:yes stop_codon:yes gene_type:complete
VAVGSVVALAGGVGGAKLAQGLAEIVEPGKLTVVVNTADDFEYLGLYICPDLDTVMYTLCDLHNLDTGWGLESESWNFLEALREIGGETWFRLGDRDLATHIQRTHRMHANEKLSDITADFCSTMGTDVRVLPMTDDPVRTMVDTDTGPIPFQEYFVRLGCSPIVRGFTFEGIQTAVFNPLASESLKSQDLKAVIICPSNPYVSIAPILSLAGARKHLRDVAVPIIAVSPIVGGQAIKGPAAKMMRELGCNPSALSVAKEYKDVIDGFVIDKTDASEARKIEEFGQSVLVTDTIMTSIKVKKRLAKNIMDFATEIKVRDI